MSGNTLAENLALAVVQSTVPPLLLLLGALSLEQAVASKNAEASTAAAMVVVFML
jgi:hypothetical protein